jgi:hypothetical protein
MKLTDEERRIADDAERHKDDPLPRLPLLLYLSTILMLCAGIVGIWERENVPQYLLLIGFAGLFYESFKLRYRYFVARSLISKLQSVGQVPHLTAGD